MKSALHFYCDFDGTIAVQDMIGAIMREFAPDSSAPLIAAIGSGQLSVKAGVEQLFALLPSERMEDIRAFATERVQLRDGFGDFCDLCARSGWPLQVVSGGFDFFVVPALLAFEGQLSIACNRLDTSGSHLRVIWTVPCDDACSGTCGLCKPTVMRQSQATGLKIVIGDGVTDERAAATADFTFARDRLLAVCKERGWPHAPFDNFYDVIAGIEHGLDQQGGLSR